MSLLTALGFLYRSGRAPSTSIRRRALNQTKPRRNITQIHSQKFGQQVHVGKERSHFHGAGYFWYAYLGARNSKRCCRMTPPCANSTSPSVKAPNALRKAHLNGMPCQLIHPTAVGASEGAYQLPRLHILPHFESFSEQHNSRNFLSDVNH
jgi:hypothetical protein